MGTITGTNRSETITGTAGVDTIHARGGNDTVRALEGNDTVYGDAGDDTIDASLGNDLVYGGLGFDRINANSGDDRVYGGDDRDDIEGRAGADLLYGERGDDSLAGGLGDDQAYGGDGADYFEDAVDDPSGRSGNDLYDGGAGRDTVDYAFSSAVWVNMGGTAPRGVQRDTHRGVEEVYGSGNDDAIRGDGAANTIRGGYGDDRLYGQAGNDVLDGGDGDNRLYAGAGRDVVGGSFGAEADYTGGDDLIDLGADRDADRAVFYQTSDAPSGSENRFIGSDVVLNFDTARDTLEIQNWESYDIFYVVDVRDFLDSNDDGRINAADQEVARSGADLVLDLGAVFQRAEEVREPGSDPFRGDASITVRGAGAGFATSRVAPPDLEVTRFETIVREDGEFPL